MFTAALFIIAKSRNNLSTDEWINMVNQYKGMFGTKKK